MRRLVSSLAVFAGLALFSLLASSNVAAAGIHGREPLRTDEHSTTVAAPSTRKWRILFDVDLMLGFGRGPVANQLQPSGAVAAPQTVLDDRSIFVESWIFSLGVGLSSGLDLRVRMPLSYMSFRSEVYRLGAASLGNVGVDVRYAAEGSRFSFGLAVTAPTAQGEPPNLARIDQNQSNRYFAGLASQTTRGHEVDYLFAWKRFGIAPSVFFFVPLSRRAAFVPYARVEGRIKASGGEGSALETSSTLGGRISHRLTGNAVAPEGGGGSELALRAFAEIPMSGVDESRVTVAIEPQLAAAAGRFVAAVGVLIPVVGPSTDPRFIGVHFLLAARL